MSEESGVGSREQLVAKEQGSAGPALTFQVDPVLGSAIRIVLIMHKTTANE